LSCSHSSGAKAILRTKIEAALRIAAVAGNGVGKSTFAAFVMLWFMSTRPNCVGRVTANTGAQLSNGTWRELSLWHNRALNKHWFTWTATRFSHVERPETWFLSAVTWNEQKPEAIAGMHGDYVLLIFDEASGIPPAIWEAVEGALTTSGAIWLVLGNATRNTGKFFECFHGMRHRWLCRTIDSRTAKMPDKALIAQWLLDYGEDSDFFRVRVKGVFPNSSTTQFIDSASVTAAQMMTDTALKTPRVMGVDVARFGDDQSVIVVRDGNKLEKAMIWQYRGLSIPDFAGHVAEKINGLSPQGVVVDGDGLGAGVVDILRDRGFKIIEFHGGAEPSDKKMYFNKRAEAWGRMKAWLTSGRASIPVSTELRDDLVGIEYGYKDTTGQLALEKKADMKKRGLASPDVADALAMTFAQAFASDAMSIARRSGGLPKTTSSSSRQFADMYRRGPKR
jgi:hypothetical protein